MLPFEHFFLKYVPCLLRSSELTIVICKVPQFAIVDHGWFADMVRQWKDRQWSSPVKCMGKDTSLSGHRPHSIRLVVCYCSSTTSWWARPGLTMYYTRLQWRELSEVCRRSRWIRLSMDAFCLAPGLFGISSGWHVVYRRSLAWTSSFSRLSKLRDGQYETAMVLSRSRNWCAGSGREIWRPDGIEGRGRERARSDRIVAFWLLGSRATSWTGPGPQPFWVCFECCCILIDLWSKQLSWPWLSYFLQSRACIAYPALSNISRISLWFRRVVSSKFRPDWYRTVSGANSKLSSCVNSNTPWTSCSAF